jgi:hypothetical protein
MNNDEWRLGSQGAEFDYSTNESAEGDTPPFFFFPTRTEAEHALASACSTNSENNRKFISNSGYPRLKTGYLWWMQNLGLVQAMNVTFWDITTITNYKSFTVNAVNINNENVQGQYQ